MTLTDILPSLDERIGAVGFIRHSIALEDIPRHASWRSRYGVVLAIDATGSTAQDIATLVQRCDGALARILDDSAAGSGHELDAHLCFFVDRQTSNLSDTPEQMLSEAKTSLFVSRKYFLDAARAVDEFAGRLTVLWPEFDRVPAPLQETIACPTELYELRGRLAESNGNTAAARFLEHLP